MSSEVGSFSRAGAAVKKGKGAKGTGKGVVSATTGAESVSNLQNAGLPEAVTEPRVPSPIPEYDVQDKPTTNPAASGTSGDIGASRNGQAINAAATLVLPKKANRFAKKKSADALPEQAKVTTVDGAEVRPPSLQTSTASTSEGSSANSRTQTIAARASVGNASDLLLGSAVVASCLGVPLPSASHTMPVPLGDPRMRGPPREVDRQELSESRQDNEGVSVTLEAEGEPPYSEMPPVKPTWAAASPAAEAPALNLRAKAAGCPPLSRDGDVPVDEDLPVAHGLEAMTLSRLKFVAKHHAVNVYDCTTQRHTVERLRAAGITDQMADETPEQETLAAKAAKRRKTWKPAFSPTAYNHGEDDAMAGMGTGMGGFGRGFGGHRPGRTPGCKMGHPMIKDTRDSVFRGKRYCDMCRKYGTAYRCGGGCDYDMCAPCYGRGGNAVIGP